MSYGPPPKTPYGDQDFIKEDFTPQHQSFQAPPPPPPMQSNYQPPGGTPQGSPYGYPPVGQQTVNTPPRRPESMSVAAELINATQSMTQEDIIFMKSFRQDLAFYKILPITAIGNGAYYYYNRTKGLPHKVSRYLLVTAACYTTAMFMSRSEMNNRLRNSQLNTPFMQAMRKAYGVPPAASEFQYGSSMSDASSGWATSQESFTRSPYVAPNQTPGVVRSDFNNPAQLPPYTNQPDFSGYEGGKGDDIGSKPSTSYEELRARNRGAFNQR